MDERSGCIVKVVGRCGDICLALVCQLCVCVCALAYVWWNNSHQRGHRDACPFRFELLKNIYIQYQSKVWTPTIFIPGFFFIFTIFYIVE